MPVPKTWKKLFCLLLAAALTAGCRAADDAPAPTPAPDRPLTDSTYILEAPQGETPPAGAGATIAVVMDAAGVEDGGRNAAVWRGVENFAASFDYSAQAFTAAENSGEALAAALNEAAQSGAGMVVCVGEALAVPLYDVQNNYPTVSYLLVDAEPHSADYSDYTAAETVHSILYREEQAAFLAGYAAVMDGYTSLGFLGEEPLPETVRYCTGFIQGAEQAAQQQGVQVTLRSWYGGSGTADADIVTRMSGWYGEGIQLILAAGGTLAESCVAAAGESGRVIAADWDHSDLGEALLTSAAKNYSVTVQRQLYTFFTGGIWGPDQAGHSERLGALEDGIGLPYDTWRFANFSRDTYDGLYAALRGGSQVVESLSDADALPATTNVTVSAQ